MKIQQLRPARRAISSVLAAVVVSSLAGSALRADEEVELFSEDFAGDLSSWENTGTAAITDGRLRVPTGSEHMRAITGGEVWDDYILEAEVEMENVAAGLVFRAVDANNFYMWQLSASTGRLRPHKKSGGSYQVLKEVTHPFQTGVAYAVKIELSGPTIRTFIDGELIDTFSDPTFTSGTIGFRHGGTETAFYDDIRVYRVVPDPPVAPGPPVGFEAVSAWDAGRPVIQLAWAAGEGELDGFELERRIGAGAWQPLSGFHAGATGFTDRWIVAEAEYGYRLRAFNIGGESAFVESSATAGDVRPIGYGEWVEARWPEASGSPVAAAEWDHDADGDGRSNGVEYALGSDPRQPDRGGELGLATEDGRLEVSSDKFSTRHDVAYDLDYSTDLAGWESLGIDLAALFETAGTPSLLASIEVDGPRGFVRWRMAAKPEAVPAPQEPVVNNLTAAQLVPLTQDDIRFGWTVGGGLQSGYQIIVSSGPGLLADGIGDVWDSGFIDSPDSQNVAYGGPALTSDTTYYWSVRTRAADGTLSPFAEGWNFRTGTLAPGYRTDSPPLVQVPVAPAEVVRKSEGHYFIDFGKAAFGTITLHVPEPEDGRVVTIHLGEALADATTVNRNPGATIRYRESNLTISAGQTDYRLTFPPYVGLYPPFISMPPEIGEVMPFRYVELVNIPDGFVGDDIRQLATHVPFDDDAADFVSSDTVLNDVWELCKYSIKATSFTGYYVDGDRERKPYEADAYLNQLCHYGVDRDYATARLTHEYMLENPTWPTEWTMHSVFIAWMDYLYSGDPRSLEENYDTLKTKTLLSRARPDGLLNGSNDDIVDWPAGERDGYDMRPVKTVISAVHYQALVWMARIAEAVGEPADVIAYVDQAELVKASINSKLWDEVNGRYIDGMSDAGAPSSHASIHANLFPLAFGIVPPERVASVAGFIKSRGMACSVYPAQYLLEGLYEAGEADHALALMNSTGLRSWANMINVGSTITLEAWDRSFKPNLDWNHAWGAVPANIIPRYLLGVRPLEPGFAKILVQPRPGTLAFARGKVPTARGPVTVAIHDNRPERFVFEVALPPNSLGRVGVPTLGGGSATVMVNGIATEAELVGDTLWLDDVAPGHHLIERSLP